MEKIAKNCRYDYTRVSLKSQKLNSSIEFQKDELIKQGVPEKIIRLEGGSAADSIQNRPVLANLIASKLKKNYLLIVTKIDRCNRNILSFLSGWTKKWRIFNLGGNKNVL